MNKETAKMTQALVDAGEKGNAAEVRRLLKAGAHIRNGDGALAMACKSGSVACVRLLLKAGANANTRGDWYTPLMWACMEGHTDVARVLLEEGGADVNAENCEFETALFLAAKNDLPELADLLLEHGADVNAWAADGTPFAQAAYQGHVRMAMHLLSREANPLIGDGLFNACAGGSLKLVKQVIAAGARPEDESYSDGFYDNPMMGATVWARRFNPAIAQLLYDRGWRFTGIEGRDVDEAGCSPRAKQWLLDHGAFDAQPEPAVKRKKTQPATVPPAADDNGASALIEAARSGNAQQVLQLLDKGVDVNAVNEEGETALMYGADAKMAMLLLAHGARADLVAANGCTAMHRYWEEEVVRRLADMGCPLDSATKHGEQPLYDAAAERRLPLVKLLLECGANANFAFRSSRNTPLHAACRGSGNVHKGRFYPVMQVLLKAGANPNAENDDGLTPLMTLCSSSHATVEQVHLLLEHGANLALETPEGWTAEDFAKKAGHRNIAKLLRNSAARTAPKP